ncbi:hypothetical protein CR105_23045 [Massilia eurypsychrophila]|uniref:DUF883 domain-containing protein n=1 Tax=Massilia eurypsychrophila TaxID=1485217 RepID=A0A2G8T9D1_9BURK|nr:DUF883 family protein [Massilia eurypsychrophila]PIL42612.1 hypothetical protein CR105_23045 [Massilia eurypsychrophila]
MFGSKMKVSTAGHEIRSIINEVEQLLSEARTSTGEKAAELEKRSLQLLSSTISKTHELEKIAINSAKDIATSTDNIVHENPWRSMAIAGLLGAGIGLLAGFALSRN